MAQSLEQAPAREQAPVASDLVLEERIVTAEEIALFEDFDEISRRFSTRGDAAAPSALWSEQALDGWGYDIAERLNSGDLSVETLSERYRVDARLPDTLRFAPIGPYGLRIERDASARPWHQRVEPIAEPPDAARHAAADGVPAAAPSGRARVP